MNFFAVWGGGGSTKVFRTFSMKIITVKNWNDVITVQNAIGDEFFFQV